MKVDAFLHWHWIFLVQLWLFSNVFLLFNIRAQFLTLEIELSLVIEWILCEFCMLFGYPNDVSWHVEEFSMIFHLICNKISYNWTFSSKINNLWGNREFCDAKSCMIYIKTLCMNIEHWSTKHKKCIILSRSDHFTLHVYIVNLSYDNR